MNVPGYKELTQSITITAGQTYELKAELQRRGPEPLTEKEIEDGLKDLPAKGMKKLVDQLGVGFAMDDDIEKRLRAAGADDSLILAIIKNKK